ncbi:hypothetical protein Btru_049408 [Bulinus truncatus]|nr:hypothetical protein Btru_049408 [Bulinus truncatus]
MHEWQEIWNQQALLVNTIVPIDSSIKFELGFIRPNDATHTSRFISPSPESIHKIATFDLDRRHLAVAPALECKHDTCLSSEMRSTLLALTSLSRAPCLEDLLGER